MSDKPEEHIIATCILCDEKITVDGEERVVLDKDAKSGKTAIFLEDIVKIDNKSYHAREITAEEAKTKILANTGDNGKIPFFCVHGFSNQPNAVIDEIASRNDVFENSKYYPVFVVWPCSSIFSEGGVIGYQPDSDTNTIESGEAFYDFVSKIPDDTFPRKSLMMHSMGNHVVFDGACFLGAPEVQFENIFMVAAVRKYFV